MLLFKINLLKKIIRKHYQSVKQFGSRLGQMFCWSWSESKLFAKVINRQQKLKLAMKELKLVNTIWMFDFYSQWSCFQISLSIWIHFVEEKVWVLISWPNLLEARIKTLYFWYIPVVYIWDSSWNFGTLTAYVGSNSLCMLSSGPSSENLGPSVWYQWMIWFRLYAYMQVHPNKHNKMGHYRSISETPF